MEKKKRFGASGYSTIYAILIFVFHSIVLRTDRESRNSSREERQAAALRLDSPIA
jgi:hypothetical protein